ANPKEGEGRKHEAKNAVKDMKTKVDPEEEGGREHEQRDALEDVKTEVAGVEEERHPHGGGGTANNLKGKACPPAPFVLASRVDPGLSVHESKEHGFRLTV
ncbi:unnamed protein product, partial [Laminaria digitata]